MSDGLELTTTRLHGAAVVSARGEVDLDTATRLNDAALAAMQEIGPTVVLDLSHVTFMDSTGLKVLLAVHKRATIGGGRLALAGSTRPVRRVIEVTGLDHVLTMCDDLDTAIADCTSHLPPSASGALES